MAHGHTYYILRIDSITSLAIFVYFSCRGVTSLENTSHKYFARICNTNLTTYITNSNKPSYNVAYTI